MAEITTASVLAQIRTLGQGLQQVSDPKPATGTSFSAALKESINAVNELQQTANEKAVRFQQDDPDTSLVDVMIASQKASLSFQAATEVRNRLVSAYQEIMNMPI